MPLAAACLVLVVVVLWRSPSEQAAVSPATMELSEVEQLESTLDDIDVLQTLGVSLAQEPASKQSL